MVLATAAVADPMESVKYLADVGIKELPPRYVKDEDERPTVPHNLFSKEVPVISLANHAPQGADRGRVVIELRRACEEWGIFQVVDHGVPRHLGDRLMSAAHGFFALPAEEKMQYAMKPGQYAGYASGSFLKDDPLMDWRELYVTTSSPRDITMWPANPSNWRYTFYSKTATSTTFASSPSRTIHPSSSPDRGDGSLSNVVGELRPRDGVHLRRVQIRFTLRYNFALRPLLARDVVTLYLCL